MKHFPEMLEALTELAERAGYAKRGEDMYRNLAENNRAEINRLSAELTDARELAKAPPLNAASAVHEALILLGLTPHYQGPIGKMALEEQGWTYIEDPNHLSRTLQDQARLLLRALDLLAPKGVL